MIITNEKRLHFGDWLIKVTCSNGCLYSVSAYNASTDTAVTVDSWYANEADAFNAMTERLRTMTPVVGR